VEGLGASRAHVVKRHRLQESGQPLVVIQAKTKPLTVLQEPSNAVVGFQQPGDGSDQVRTTLLHLNRGRTVQAQFTDLGVNGVNRPIDVLGIHAGAHHERTVAHARVERAEGVVRHPLTFSDVIRQSSAQPKLPKNVVEHPICVIPRIEAADRGEPVGDLRL
jgi:hypothetical protein